MQHLNQSPRLLPNRYVTQAQQRFGKHALRWQLHWLALVVGLISGCGQLDAIESPTKISPEAFLQQQPSVHVTLGPIDFILCQPSSSIFVLLVAFCTMYAGYKFLQQADGQRARQGWGIGLLLTGLGALLAGVSYQAGGYEIKCAGHEFCTFTSWWEVAYMFFSAIGLAAMMTGSAYCTALGNVRKILMAVAWLLCLAYVMLLTYGISAADRFLVSFDLMAVFSSIIVLFLLGYHFVAFARWHARAHLTHIRVWLLFIVVSMAYLGYLYLGISQALWAQGIWFTENDVLHFGMVFWVYYVYKHLLKALEDRLT